MKSLEDILYDINDLVQSVIEDYDTNFLGEEFKNHLHEVDSHLTKMCIIHDVATL